MIVELKHANTVTVRRMRSSFPVIEEFIARLELASQHCVSKRHASIGKVVPHLQQ
jgi:hypothetical protein